VIVIVASSSISTVNALTTVVTLTPLVSHVRTLVSYHSQADGDFGWSVALSSGVVVVGAPDEMVSGSSEAGRVYVFNVKTGALTQTLVSPNSQVDGYFGVSVALSGGAVVIGATGENVHAGRVYVFNAKTGALTRTLVSPNAETWGGFGNSVALSGGVVVVGALWETVGGSGDAGRVYVFNAKTGALTQTLVSPNAQTYGLFGDSVALTSSVIAVGANGETVSGNSGAGRVYVFNVKTGALTQTLVSPNSQVDGCFGCSVALNGDALVVGADESVNGNSGAGRVYVFNVVGGFLTWTLTSPNSQTNGGFGSSVAWSSDVLVLGAPYETVGGNSAAGRAYVFNTKTAALTQTLVSPNSQTNGYFGRSVAVSSGVVVVGAWGETVGGNSAAGRAYIFRI